MADKKMRVAPGTLLRMSDGSGCLEGLGPEDCGAFFATALGRGRLFAPDRGGEMRVWKGITFWEPGTGGTAGGSATIHGDDESWLHAEIVGAV